MNQYTNFICSATTAGITVAVEVRFQPKYSIPYSDQNVFTYHIQIKNTNSFTVQLLRRHWWIWESNGSRREVKGEGVIGEQPIIAPGDAHDYESFCPILSPLGHMQGTYQMIRLDTEEIFQVEIPMFQLAVPEIQN
jgi:ApaG protein